MKIIDWLGNTFLKKNKSVVIQTDNYYRDTENRIALEAFSLFSVIEMISALIGKCEFKTYRDGREFKGRNWYALNVRPNKNQNAPQFWQEYVSKLLYYREALIISVKDQMIIADDFNKREYAVKETVFSQVSRGDMLFNKAFKISDVCYTKYTNSDARAAIDNIFFMYEKLVNSAADKYIRSGGQKGVLKVPAIAQNEKGFEEKYRELMNNYFKAYFKAENAVLPLWGGIEYTPTASDGAKKSTSEISDISKLVSEALARAAQAYRVPPALVSGEVAGIKEAFDLLLSACIDPLADMISKGLTGAIYTVDETLRGCYVEADTSRIRHMDIFDIAVGADKLISSGVMSPNEVRKAIRLSEINEEWANAHYITKNYQESAKGGEQNGN